MSTNKRQGQARPPAWTWAFVALCGAIPVVSLGGALPGIIGGLGAMACYGLARDGKGSLARRVVSCSLVALAAWGAFGTLAWAVTRRGGKRTVVQRSSSSGVKTSRTRIKDGVVVYHEEGRAERTPPDEMSENELREIYLDAVSDRSDSHQSFVASHNKLFRLELDRIVAEGDAAGWGD